MSNAELSCATDGDNDICLSDQVRHRAVGDDGIVVHLRNGRVIVVNEVGLYIIQLLQKPKNRRFLIRSIISEFDVAADQAELDLVKFLNSIGQEDILELGESIDHKY
jgi:hypothetical protein